MEKLMPLPPKYYEIKEIVEEQIAQGNVIGISFSTTKGECEVASFFRQGDTEDRTRVVVATNYSNISPIVRVSELADHIARATIAIDEAAAHEKLAFERAQKAQAEREAFKESPLGQYLSTMSTLKAGKVRQALEKRASSYWGLLPRHQIMERMVAEGRTTIAHHPSWGTYIKDSTGQLAGYITAEAHTKTALDYALFLIENHSN